MRTFSIERLVDEFEANPVQARRRFQEAWDANPEKFYEKAVEILCRNGKRVGGKYLVSFLMQNANLAERLADTEHMTREESVSLARLAMRVDPSLDIKIAMRVASAEMTQQANALRLLEVLESVAEPGNLLPMLSQVLRHPDAKVRSKAALLMGKGNQNAGWVRKQMMEPDGRVRANAVEALWGLRSEEAAELFRGAAQDSHPRVVVNGVLGLYLTGATQAVELFHELAGHPDASFRSSTAWGLGRTQDPRFLRELGGLVRDSDAKVRANALRSTVRIRNYRGVLEAYPALQIRTVCGKILPSGERLLQLAVRQAGRPDLPLLPALSFATEEDGQPVVRFEAEPVRGANVSLGIILPASDNLDGPTRAAMEEALKRALSCKPAPEQWAIAVHTHADSADATSQTGVTFQESAAKILTDWEAAGKSPLAGYLPAVASLLPGASVVRPNRALIVFASAMPESTSIVFHRQYRFEKVKGSLVEGGIPVHVVAPAACPPLLCTSLQEICLATGGTFHNADTPEDAANLMENLVSGVHPSYTLRYWGFPKHTAQAAVRLLLNSTIGLGEHTTQVTAVQKPS